MAQSDELLNVGCSLGRLLSSKRFTQSTKTRAPFFPESKWDSMSPLKRALDCNWRLVGQELVKQGFEINVQDAQGQNLLHDAVNKPITEDSCAWVEILAKGASANLALLQRDNRGETPLHRSFTYDRFEIVGRLIRVLKTPEEIIMALSLRDNKGAAPLHLAVLHYDIETVERSVGMLVTPEGSVLSTENKQKAKDLLTLKHLGQSVLHIAASQPKQKITRILLRAAEFLNIVQDLLLDEDYAGRTPLWIAADRGALETIQTLIIRRSDPEHANKDSVTPLDRMKNRFEPLFIPFRVRLLETEPNSWSEEFPSLVSAVRLHYAVEENNLHLTEKTLDAAEHFQDVVNSVDIESGKTPLHWAAENGSLKLVELLLQPGSKVDLNVKDTAGNTPIHYAVAGARLEIVRALVDQGARLDIANSIGHTPFDIAEQRKDDTMMQVVADPDNYGWISSSEDEGSFGYYSDSHSDEGDNEEYGSDD